MVHAAFTTESNWRSDSSGSGEFHSTSNPPVVNGHTRTTRSIQPALLATSAVRVTSSTGEYFPCRAFLDNGSSVSFITEAAARRLKLKLTPNTTPVTGLSASPVGIATHSTSILVKPRFESKLTYTVNVLVINRISNDLPTVRCNPDNFHHIRYLQLADPLFGSPAPVDLLLGSDVFWNVLRSGKISGNHGQPLAIESSLGWLIACNHSTTTPVNTFITNVQPNKSLQRFRDQEEVTPESSLNQECKKHFHSSSNSHELGRFAVSTSWKIPEPVPAESRLRAVQRLFSQEFQMVHHNEIQHLEKIRKLGEHWEAYKDFMCKYNQLGHITLLSSNPPIGSFSCNMSHHFVVKESSTTPEDSPRILLTKRTVPSQENVPKVIEHKQEILVEEETALSHVVVPAIPEPFSKSSSRSRFQRVAARIYRFVETCKMKKNKEEINHDQLSTTELQHAHSSSIRAAKSCLFHEDVQAPKKKDESSKQEQQSQSSLIPPPMVDSPAAAAVVLEAVVIRVPDSSAAAPNMDKKPRGSPTRNYWVGKGQQDSFSEVETRTWYCASRQLTAILNGQ